MAAGISISQSARHCQGQGRLERADCLQERLQHPACCVDGETHHAEIAVNACANLHEQLALTVQLGNDVAAVGQATHQR